MLQRAVPVSFFLFNVNILCNKNVTYIQPTSIKVSVSFSSWMSSSFSFRLFCIHSALIIFSYVVNEFKSSLILNSSQCLHSLSCLCQQRILQYAVIIFLKSLVPSLILMKSGSLSNQHFYGAQSNEQIFSSDHNSE